MAAIMRTAMFLLFFTVTIGTINADRLDDLEKKFEERIKSREAENSKQLEKKFEERIKCLEADNSKLKEQQRRHENERKIDKQQLGDLQKKFDALIKSLEAENSELKEQRRRHGNENMRLNIEIEELKMDKEQIMNRQQQMEATMTRQQKEISRMSLENVALKEKVLENKEVGGRHEPGSTTPAFHAYNSVDLPAAPGYVLIFDTAIYNSGEYGTTSGIFACSVTGIYVFSFAVEAYSGNVAAGLYIDTTKIAGLYARIVSGSYYTARSGTAVARCGQYSEAMVKYEIGSGLVYRLQYSWFNGFLLHATS